MFLKEILINSSASYHNLYLLLVVMIKSVFNANNFLSQWGGVQSNRTVKEIKKLRHLHKHSRFQCMFIMHLLLYPTPPQPVLKLFFIFWLFILIVILNIQKKVILKTQNVQQYSIVQKHQILFIHSLICGHLDFGLFPVLSICEQIFVWTQVCISLRQIPESEIILWCVPNFIRNCQTGFQTAWNHFALSQPCIRVLALHPHQHLVLSVFFILTILLGMQQCFMISVFISLMT